MATVNSLNVSGAGIVKYDGSGVFSAVTTTQYTIQVGSTSNGLTSIGPGSSGQVLQSGGAAANPAYSTATFPSTATGTGTVMRADGTNWVATTATYPTTTTINEILYSSAANTIAGITTANNGVMLTSSAGVPFISNALNLVSSATNMGQLQCTDSGAAAGPTFSLLRDSASPAAADILGQYLFTGRNSAAAVKTYAAITTLITDTTSTAEKGQLSISTISSGTVTDQIVCLSTGSQIRGNNTNTTPPAGYLGEITSATATTGALTNNTAANVTSVSLTAGIWDIYAVNKYATTGTVAGNVQWECAISTASASLGSLVGENGGGTDGGKLPVSGVNGVSSFAGPTRATLSATTTIYLNCRGYASTTFTNVTCTGLIRAVRVG